MSKPLKGEVSAQDIPPGTPVRYAATVSFYTDSNFYETLRNRRRDPKTGEIPILTANDVLDIIGDADNVRWSIRHPGHKNETLRVTSDLDGELWLGVPVKQDPDS